MCSVLKISRSKNKLIDETLESFQIQRSLNMKGCPYDNAVAEATYKIIKTEFVRGRCFSSLEELNLELADYVNWFNNHRIHSALGYQTPESIEKITLKKLSNKVLTIQYHSFVSNYFFN